MDILSYYDMIRQPPATSHLKSYILYSLVRSLNQ
jgi:hypothetical protein